MVDVTGKFSVQREAEALGRIRLRADTLRAINEKKMEKGDVIEAAKIAAMMAVKNTPLILPHCHPLSITGVDVDVGPVEDGVEVLVRVRAVARTGVEMEALCGVMAGLLCVWDMVKGMEKDAAGQYPTTEIVGVRVVKKRKGGAPKHHREDARYTVGFITVSTTRGKGSDQGGDEAEAIIRGAGHEVLRFWAQDDVEEIRRAVREALATCDAIIVSGGTGITPSDLTPEALEEMLEKKSVGFSALFAQAGGEQVGAAAALSRALAGVMRGKPLFLLPGNPRAVRLALERLILPELDHWVVQARGTKR